MRKIQVHFHVTNYTVTFNSLFESPGFLFFHALGTTIAEAICYTKSSTLQVVMYKTVQVFSVVFGKATALLLRQHRKRKRWRFGALKLASAPEGKVFFFLVILSISRTVCV